MPLPRPPPCWPKPERRPSTPPRSCRPPSAKRALIAAHGRRDNLELSGETTSGPTAYLADVDADQVDVQLATLEAAIQAVSARKAGGAGPRS